MNRAALRVTAAAVASATIAPRSPWTNRVTAFITGKTPSLFEIEMSESKSW